MDEIKREEKLVEMLMVYLDGITTGTDPRANSPAAIESIPAVAKIIHSILRPSA